MARRPRKPTKPRTTQLSGAGRPLISPIFGDMAQDPFLESTNVLFKKEQNKNRMLRGLDKIDTQNKVEGSEGLPFPWKYQFKLLGVILDSRWTFEEHFKNVQLKAKKRIAILRKVSGTKWGLDSRILTAAAHALIESITNYGLAITGTNKELAGLKEIDLKIMHPIARQITGTNRTIRREILYPLADLRAIDNHYVQKTANMLDRTLRPTGTKARSTALEYLREKGIGDNRESGKIRWAKLNKWVTNSYSEKYGGPKKRELLNRIKEIQDINIIEKECANNTNKIKPQESIFWLQAEIFTNNKDTKKLTFQRHQTQNSYEAAASILGATGWTPEVTYEGRNHLPNLRKIPQVKVEWNNEEEEVWKGGKREIAIEIHSFDIEDPEIVATGTILYEENNKTKIKETIHGIKYTQNPTHQNGTGFMECLNKGK